MTEVILKFGNERFKRCVTCERPIAVLRDGRLRRHYVIDEKGRHQCYDRKAATAA
jgi:hypothetical protein